MQRWAMVGLYANYPGDFRYINHSLVAELPDAIYPYVFSIPIDEEKGGFEFIFEVEKSDIGALRR